MAGREKLYLVENGVDESRLACACSSDDENILALPDSVAENFNVAGLSASALDVLFE